jgi:sarcosine oxidase subunit beta
VDILEGLCETSLRHGLDVSMIRGGDKVHAFCPYCSEEIGAAAWCPTDGHANPLRATLGFYKMARRLGAAYYTGEKAIRLATSRGRVRKVFTEGGNLYEADAVILAAGYAGRSLANTVGVDMPFRQKRIEMLVTEQAPPMFSFMMAAPAGFYGHQTAHGSFVFGGDSGYEHHPVFCGDAPTIAPTAPAISRGVMSYFPGLGELRILRTWAGWIDLCLDLVPVLGPVQEVSGLYVAAGYSAHGFCLGPVSGRMLSELAAGEQTCVDWRALRYDRFTSCQ